MRRGSLNDRGIAFDLRTVAQSVEAALSSGIGSLIKFSIMEGFVTAELGCFIIENRHKLVATITFRSKRYSSRGREEFIEIIICSVYTCHKSIQDTIKLNRDCYAAFT